MTSVRTAKSKGSCMEYDSQESLQQLTLFNDIYRTSERGYQRQYDLHSDNGKSAFECKRLKGISWNQAKSFFEKLQKKSPIGFKSFLLFKSNNQPCLVMYSELTNNQKYIIKVEEFESFFGVPFVKHKSTRNTDKV